MKYRATVKGPGVTPDVMWQGERCRRVRQGARREERADRPARANGSAAQTDGLRVPLGSARVAERGAEQRELFPALACGRLGRRRRVDGRRAGLTVSSLVSLSLEPPLVAISIAHDASLYEVLREAGEWAASILSGEQEQLAQHFARSVPPIVLWDGIEVREDDPRLLAGAVGWLTRAHGRRGAHRRPHALRRRGADGRGGPREPTSLVYVHRGYSGAVIEAVVFDLDGVIVDSEQVWDEVRERVRARERRPLRPGARRGR